MERKLKSFLRSEQTFLSALMVLVGIFSFQLGQASVEVQNGEGNKTQNPAGVIFSDAAESAIPVDAIKVVASRSGTRYHKLDCPGANSIKEENKIYFDSIELAKAAGYVSATNCKWE